METRLEVNTLWINYPCRYHCWRCPLQAICLLPHVMTPWDTLYYQGSYCLKMNTQWRQVLNKGKENICIQNYTFTNQNTQKFHERETLNKWNKPCQSNDMNKRLEFYMDLATTVIKMKEHINYIHLSSWPTNNGCMQLIHFMVYGQKQNPKEGILQIY